MFDKRHRLNLNLVRQARGENVLGKPEIVPLKPHRFKMRVKQLQIAQQFTPQHYLQKHLPTIHDDQQRAYFSTSPNHYPTKMSPVLSSTEMEENTSAKTEENTMAKTEENTMAKTEENTMAKSGENMMAKSGEKTGKKPLEPRTISVKKLPYDSQRLYSGELGRQPRQRRDSLRRKLRNAVESNKSLLVVSSVCFLAGTLILISSLFTNNVAGEMFSSSGSNNNNNEGSNDDRDPNISSTSSTNNQNEIQSPKSRNRRITSLTLFGFTFIGIGFSILSLTIFLIVCCHVNKWLAIKRRPSSSLFSNFRSDSVTSLISRRRPRSIEDSFHPRNIEGTRIQETKTKIMSPEPFQFDVDPGQSQTRRVSRDQELNSSCQHFVSTNDEDPHEVNHVTLVDIEGIEEDENVGNKSTLGQESHVVETQVTEASKSSNDPTKGVKLKEKKDETKQRKKEGKKEGKKHGSKVKEKGANERKNRLRERGWIT